LDKLPYCDEVYSTNTLVVSSPNATTTAADYTTATNSDIATEATNTDYPISAAVYHLKESSLALLVVSAFAVLVLSSIVEVV
jgi:hypothetical protein